MGGGGSKVHESENCSEGEFIGVGCRIRCFMEVEGTITGLR